MPTRAFWKGYLKLALVTCPVAMTPATTEGEKVRFHTLNQKTGNRVVSQYIDATTGKPVKEDDEVKGYQRGDDEYVMLEDDEIEAVGLESTRNIDIETFVPRESIDWIWYDKPHYLVPDDAVGEEAFSVIREAMHDMDVLGIARVVLYRRERAVMLEPRDNGIVLWTLHYGDEVRKHDPDIGAGNSMADTKLVNMLKQVIDKRTKPWSAGLVEDPVQANLLDLIAERKKGRKKTPKAKAKAPERKGNVIDITEALKRSLAEGKAAKKA
jgi:DNA end-binding protein Ku